MHRSASRIRRGARAGRTGKVILVTGGAGYVGSHTAKKLHLAGYRTVVLDNLSTGHRWALKYGRFVKVELLDLKKTGALLKAVRPSAVVHFAASAEVEDSMANPSKYFRNNVVSTLHLLLAMRAARCRHLVFSSTAAVYGDAGGAGPHSRSERRPRSEADGGKRLFKETDPLRPINPYGESKVMCERIMDWGARSGALGYVTFRYFNAAGADPDGELGEIHTPEKHLIPNILRFAAGIQKKLFVFGRDYPTRDGTCMRDYYHVADIAEAHVRAIDYLSDGGGSCALNLGTGRGRTVLEMIRTAEQVTGKSLQPIFAPRRPGDPAFLVADGRKAAHVLGFTPAFSDPPTIIRTAWNWLRRQNRVN